MAQIRAKTDLHSQNSGENVSKRAKIGPKPTAKPTARPTFLKIGLMAQIRAKTDLYSQNPGENA